MTARIEASPNKLFTTRIAHLRFTAQNTLFAASAVGLLAGGVWTWAPFVIATTLINIVDATCGADKTRDPDPPIGLHRAMLYLTPLLLAINVTLFAYQFTADDPLRLDVLLRYVGLDFEASRKATTSFDLLMAGIAQGFNYSVAMSTCHELLHCTNSPLKMTLSRWISALILSPWFLIHHTGLHHRYVGLPFDVETPPRGMSVYQYAARAVPANTLFAERQERKRLAQRGVSYWSWQNRFLNGWIILATVAAYFSYIGGPMALLAYVLSGAFGRLLLDATGYIQHYGVIRVEGEPIEPRHSWDVYRVGTNALLNDIGRHADHHDRPLRPSVELTARAGAPELHHGYLTMITFSLAPPLFKKIMQPKLDEWDRHFATAADLAYMRANGIPCAQR